MKIKIRLAPKVRGTFGGWKKGNVVRFALMQIELYSFYISRELAVKFHWSLTTHQIKSTTSDFDFRRV
jgi:hypothetical protein